MLEQIREIIPSKLQTNQTCGSVRDQMNLSYDKLIAVGFWNVSRCTQFRASYNWSFKTEILPRLVKVMIIVRIRNCEMEAFKT